MIDQSETRNKAEFKYLLEKCQNVFALNKSCLKVQVHVPMHEPLEVVRCEKCRKAIAEPKEPISITNPNVVKTC